MKKWLLTIVLLGLLAADASACLFRARGSTTRVRVFQRSAPHAAAPDCRFGTCR